MLADCLQLYAAHYEELAQVLKLEETAVAGLHEDLAAVDGIVQGVVGVVLEVELLAQGCECVTAELGPDLA